MSARTPVKWTPAARSRVIALYRDPAHSGTTIAAVIRAEYGLSITASSVIGIAYRGSAVGVRPPPLTYEELLVRHRDQRRVKRAAARADRPAPAPKPPKAPKPAPVAKATPAPRPAPIAVPVRAQVLSSLRIPLTEALIGACRLIADDPRDGPATVCGHPAAHGSPWCAGHRAICTVPVRPVWIPVMRRAA